MTFQTTKTYLEGLGQEEGEELISLMAREWGHHRKGNKRMEVVVTIRKERNNIMT